MMFTLLNECMYAHMYILYILHVHKKHIKSSHEPLDEAAVNDIAYVRRCVISITIWLGDLS